MFGAPRVDEDRLEFRLGRIRPSRRSNTSTQQHQGLRAGFLPMASAQDRERQAAAHSGAGPGPGLGDERRDRAALVARPQHQRCATAPTPFLAVIAMEPRLLVANTVIPNDSSNATVRGAG